jgi:hypothetical protein
VEPHCYDLCQSHAQNLSAPRGWEVIRLTVEAEPKPSTDDLLALADAVRDAGLSYDPPTLELQTQVAGHRPDGLGSSFNDQTGDLQS